MPNRILVLFFVIILFTKNTFGQQNPQFSQYLFNQIYFNPAVTGFDEAPRVQLIHRSQYLGYESNFDKGGTLNTQSLTFQLPLIKSNSGVGIVIINDQAGLQKNQQVRFTYSKNFKLRQGIFSVGASAGMYNKSFDNNFRPRENSDPLIPSEGINQMRPDLGLGVYYTAKSYFGGISLNNINNPKFDFGTAEGKSIINRNVSVLAGLNISINKNIELKPSFLLRTDLQTYTMEGGIIANIGTKYWLGASYRRQDAAILMAGVNLMKDNNLRLGMAYDIVTGFSKVKSASSFEIMASYLLGGGSSKTKKMLIKNPIIRTPRFRH